MSDSMHKKKEDKGADNPLITQAMTIVVERQKQRKNLKNHSRRLETMHDVVSQKKEIFLVTMTTDIIEKER